MALTDDQKKLVVNLGQMETILEKVDIENTIKSVTVNGTALAPNNKTVALSIGLTKKVTANTGYAASYQMTVNGTALSTDIDIPKDYLVKSATMETCTVADTPIAGLAVGDPYLDFVINAVDNSETAQHIYINVKDLVDVYTAGNGLALSNGEFSVVVDSSNANGLSVGASGVAMALATPDVYTSGTKTADGTAGALSSADKYKLDHLNIAADSDITQLITEVYGS